VNIGQGTAVTGTFSSINWGSGGKFMQVEFDSTATGSHYLDLGTQQLMSVPYALNAGNGVPAGSVIANAGNTLQAGWLLCNGQAISRSTYANLFASIGTTYGIGDGSSTFNVPDYRGMFLRGVDAGAGNDPDTATRVAQGSGTAVGGGNLGTLQKDAFQGHWHSAGEGGGSAMDVNPNFLGYFTGYKANYYTPAMGKAFPSNDGVDGNPRYGSETRPKNVYVNYIIKY